MLSLTQAVDRLRNDMQLVLSLVHIELQPFLAACQGADPFFNFLGNLLATFWISFMGSKRGSFVIGCPRVQGHSIHYTDDANFVAR